MDTLIPYCTIFWCAELSFQAARKEIHNSSLFYDAKEVRETIWELNLTNNEENIHDSDRSNSLKIYAVGMGRKHTTSVQSRLSSAVNFWSDIVCERNSSHLQSYPDGTMLTSSSSLLARVKYWMRAPEGA